MSGVRYVVNGDNRVLRHVLVTLWNQQCYWCRRLKEYGDLQIDHVLPRTADAQMEDRLRRAFNMPANYDVNEPYNLAPICAPCNREKSGADLTEFGLVLTQLKKAGKLAEKVTSQVMSFGRSADLANAFLHIAEVDLEDVDAQTTFKREAPAVLQKAAELGVQIMGYRAFETVDVELGNETQRVALELDQDARMALTILTEVVGGSLAGSLKAPLSELFEKIEEEAQAALEHHDSEKGIASVGPGVISWPEITIDQILFLGVPPARVELRFAGSLSAFVSASAVRQSSGGDGLDDLQGEAIVAGDFSFHLSWEPDDEVGELSLDYVWLDASDVVVWFE